MLALLSLVAGASGQSFFAGSEDFKLAGGAATLTETISHSIPSVVRPFSPVVKLEVMRGGKVDVTVQRSKTKHKQYRTRVVVVTTPPGCWSKISGLQRLTPIHAPTMERNRLLTLVVDMKGTGKVKTEDVLTDGVCRLIWCESQNGANRGDFYHFRVLACPFLGGSRLSKVNISHTALDILRIPSAKLMAVYEHRWDRSPWSHGSYPVFGLGALSSDHSSILDGVPPILFAGDFVIPGYAGYMEGALRSAERTANRIKGLLKNS